MFNRYAMCSFIFTTKHLVFRVLVTKLFALRKTNTIADKCV